MADGHDAPERELQLAHEAMGAFDLDGAVAHLSAAIRQFTARGESRPAAMASAQLGNVFAIYMGNLTAGRACARNPLLKTALVGTDPNWGRVLAAIGTTAAAFDADQVAVTINGVTVCRGGAIGDPREGVDLTGRAITIDVDLKAGTERA